MNPPPPITPAERWLCLALALLWSGAATWVFAGPYGSDGLVMACTKWVFEQWKVLRTASLPEFSSGHFLAATVTSALVGVVLLAAQYLAEFIGRGRWLRLRALWFWTWLHALLSAVYPHLGDSGLAAASLDSPDSATRGWRC
jgi:hypothetical protein